MISLQILYAYHCMFDCAAVSFLLTVKGSIVGHGMSILVDTGSGVTLLWEVVRFMPKWWEYFSLYSIHESES